MTKRRRRGFGLFLVWELTVFSCSQLRLAPPGGMFYPCNFVGYGGLHTHGDRSELVLLAAMPTSLILFYTDRSSVCVSN